MFWWLTQHLLQVAVLAVLVALACRLGRLRPAVRHALWLVVLLKLLTPPVVQWTLPLPAAPWQVDEATLPAEVANELPAVAAAGDLWPEDLVVVVDEAEAPAPVEEEAVAVPAEFPWTVVVLAAWLMGSAAMLALQLVRIARLRRLVADGGPAPAWLTQQLLRLAAAVGVRAPTPWVVWGKASPMLWSLGRPRLLWPEALLEQLPARCRPGVLVHELAHLRRRDHWVGWLLLVGDCVCWWNPLYWYVRRQVQTQAELACDAWVLHTLPGERRAYAEALIGVTEWLSRTTAPAPAVGLGARRHDFERRLKMIMKDSVPCRLPLRGLLLIGTLAVLVLPAWTLGQSAREERKVEVQVIKKEAAEPKDVIVEVVEEEQPKIYIRRLAGTTVEEKPGAQETVERKVIELKTKLAQVAGAGAEADRLEAVEKKLKELLDEVSKLRATQKRGAYIEKELKPGTVGVPGTPAVPATPAKPGLPGAQAVPFKVVVPMPALPKVATPEGAKTGALRLLIDTEKLSAEKQAEAAKKLAEAAKAHAEAAKGGHVLWATPRTAGAEGAEVALSRATYKLPKGQAEALGKFLSENVKAAVLETKVQDDQLIVTTTPDAQRVISQVVNLMSSKTGTGANYYRYKIETQVKP